ncbi:MAG: thiol-activated cytolysin family protein [Treponemataceae bacterium]|nr:thiol-activated cytolysin family protein [Treponemataceae bacterium]
MKQNKHNLFFISCTAVLALSIFFVTGCVTSRAKNLISSGDKVAAIELLAERLCSKPADAESAELFASVYPSAAEERLPAKNVSDIIRKNFYSYSGNPDQAIRLCAAEMDGKPLKNHSLIYRTISECEKAIDDLADLSRIQRAVYPMPASVGNAKKGILVNVRKYTDDFSMMHEIAKKEMAAFYVSLADAEYPGNTLAQKKEILSFYSGARKYDSYSITDKTKIQSVSYEVAMVLKNNAQTKDDLSEVISYFDSAEGYADSKVQIADTKYMLALLYKADHTRNSYEKAGKLFTEIGNYKDAENEAVLYAFYNKLNSLFKNSNYSDVYLTTERKPTDSFDCTLTETDSGSSRLRVSAKTSRLNAYTSGATNSIFPGAIIEGQSVPNQKFTLFTAGKRNPVDFVLSSNGRQVTSGTVQDTVSSYSALTSVQKAARSAGYSISPRTEYEFKTIHGNSDLNIALGVGFDRNRIILSNMGLNSDSDRSFTLVKVSQVFYSAEVPEPVLPVDFFAAGKDSVTSADLSNVTPYYVSDVDYGRQAFFLISSNLSSQEIIDDITKYRPADSNNSGAFGLWVNSDVSRKWRNSNTMITAVTVSEKLYAVSDIDGMYQWIKAGVDRNVAIEDLLPVSFRLRNLCDNTYAVLSQDAEEWIRN